MVPTTAHQAEDALEALAPVSGDATFLVFSGNWEGTAFIDRLLPRDRYVMGYADAGGTVREDGVYWTNLGGEVHLGAVDAAGAEALDRVKALFARADIAADVPDNIVYWIWAHVAGAIGFSAGFAKPRDLPAYLQDSDLLRECVLSTRELYKLCELRGVDMKKYPEAGFIGYPLWLVVLLLRQNFKRNESMQRFTAHAASDSSLRETKAYFAQVMETAAQYGLDMPHTRALGVYLG